MGMNRILCFVVLGVLFGFGIEGFLSDRSMLDSVVFNPPSSYQPLGHGTAVPVWSKDDASRPQISCDHEVFEFVFEGDEKLYHDFLIINSGASPLHISDVASTCGCTVVQHYDKVVSPGRQTSIRVEIDVSSLNSRTAEKAILVRSNDPIHSEMILRIRVSFPALKSTGPTEDASGDYSPTVQ